MIVGSEVRIYDNIPVAGNDLGTELVGIESNPDTQFIYSHPGDDVEVAVQILSTNYEEEVRRVLLGRSNQLLSIIPAFDPNL